MGRDKARIELAGKPLIDHAVRKLRRICIDVRILGSRPELAAFAPLVPDLHPGCGPMAGMEAALAHSSFDWNLFLPVDVPFLPSAFLSNWVRSWLEESKTRDTGARIRMFTVAGRPQPGVCLLHKEVGPILSASLDRGEHKLLPAFEAAGRALTLRHGLPPGAGLCNMPLTWLQTSRPESHGESRCSLSVAQARWFANLNTPEDLAEAEVHVDALDT